MAARVWRPQMRTELLGQYLHRFQRSDLSNSRCRVAPRWAPERVASAERPPEHSTACRHWVWVEAAAVAAVRIRWCRREEDWRSRNRGWTAAGHRGQRT